MDYRFYQPAHLEKLPAHLDLRPQDFYVLGHSVCRQDRHYRNFQKAGIKKNDITGSVNIVAEQEKNLALKLLCFGEILDQVADQGFPHILCSYLYEIASLYMVFYEHCPILKENVELQTKNSRLILSKIASLTLAKGLDLLGIEVMEKM